MKVPLQWAAYYNFKNNRDFYEILSQNMPSVKVGEQSSSPTLSATGPEARTRRCDDVLGTGGHRMPTAPDDIPPCAGCGLCCHLVVELIPGVDDDVPEDFVVEHEGVRCMEQRGDGACLALDTTTRLCTIYERRPDTCRRLKRAESLCRMALARYAASKLPSATPA